MTSLRENRWHQDGAYPSSGFNTRLHQANRGGCQRNERNHTCHNGHLRDRREIDPADMNDPSPSHKHKGEILLLQQLASFDETSHVNVVFRCASDRRADWSFLPSARPQTAHPSERRPQWQTDGWKIECCLCEMRFPLQIAVGGIQARTRRRRCSPRLRHGGDCRAQEPSCCTGTITRRATWISPLRPRPLAAGKD
jgi:hypothetical protein